jgi:hypothetical protein
MKTLMRLAALACLFAWITVGAPRRNDRPQPGRTAVSSDRLAIASTAPAARAAKRSAPSQSKILQSYGSLPLAFEANRGQTDSRVKFLSHGAGYTLFLADGEAVLALKQKRKMIGTQMANAGNPQTTTALLRTKLVGSNQGPIVTGVGEMPGKTNYFIGNNPGKWRTSVPSYAKVKYEGVYPGVDLIYYGSQSGRLEYDFVVAPGADPRAVTLELDSLNIQGAKPKGNHSRILNAKCSIDAHGDLVVKIDGGELRFRKPLAYQQGTGGEKEFVEARYFLEPPKSKPHDREPRIHFRLGQYDRRRTLVIDPALSYSTFLGGSDTGYAIAADAAGNAYVTGTTNSPTFPITSGAFQPGLLGASNAFVSKLNSLGTALVYSTYLGGGGDDTGYAIAVDTNGDAYVTGNTTSSDFPTTPGAFQKAFAGGCYSGNLLCGDAFVTEINPTGTALVYSTFLGGASYDVGYGIALDSANSAYVTGNTISSDFPSTAGAFQTSNAGGCNQSGPPIPLVCGDAFVAKVNPSGSGLVYATYLGGSGGGDVAYGIALDSAMNAYVTGFTWSSNFPVKGGYQDYCQVCALGGSGAISEGFVTELNPAGSAEVYSTYLGGQGPYISGVGFTGYKSDGGYAITADASGNAFITGQTASANFPVTPGCFQDFCPACIENEENEQNPVDAFVTELNSSGDLVSSTFLGGTPTGYGDVGQGIALDAAEDIYITGHTSSSDFPTTPGAFQAGCESCYHLTQIFMSELNPSVSALVYSTSLGLAADATGTGIAMDPSGNPYITGWTTSNENSPPAYPTTPGALQSICNNFTGAYCPGNVAFMTKFIPGDQVWPLSLSFGNQLVGFNSSPQTTTLTNSGSTTLNISGITVTGSNPADFPEINTCGATLAAGANCTITVTFDPMATGNRSASISISDSAANSPQAVLLSGLGLEQAQVMLSSTKLTFTSQLVGTTSPAQNVTLTNTGNETLDIASIAASGDFAQTNTCGSTVGAGANCMISVTFTPSAMGKRTGAVTITDNAPDSPEVIMLAGTGIAPVVMLKPTSLGFGGENVGQTSAPMPSTLTNIGNAPLTISNIGLGGADPGDFAQMNDCPLSPSTLAPKSSCTIMATFTPLSEGAQAAFISITDDASGSPQNVHLTGTGIAPVADLSPANLNFGNQNVGATSAPMSVTLTNSGNATLTITSITITGTNFGDFAQTNTCGSTLAPRAKCAISVTFTPTAIGARSASLSVTDNAAGSPQAVSLSGNGTAPAVNLAPTSLTFGVLYVGFSSKPQKVTITNSGTGPLVFSSIGITGADSSDFGQTNNCPVSPAKLGAGQKCGITVTFTPTAGGTRTASISIADNAVGSPQTVPLTGTGEAVQLSPTQLYFNKVKVGKTSAPQIITLTNRGNTTLNITSINITGADPVDFAQSNNCGSTVVAGGNCAISATFTPTARGLRTAAVSISDDGGGSPQMVSLNGTGT